MITANSLYDRIIDCDFYIKDKLAAQIRTPKNGIKPKITFSWNRVPGQFTYKCQLEITNWYVLTNWFEYTSVTIRAGYSTNYSELTDTISCQIFAAHKPYGGPDTPVIFECIVAKTESKVLNTKPFKFEYAKGSVGDVITETCNKLGFKARLCLNYTLLNKPFSAIKLDESFSSGYQVLNYIYKSLNKFIKVTQGNLQMIVFNQDVIFLQRDSQGNIASNKVADAELSTVSVPYLDKTTDATFTAGTLSITAPWNPKIAPGTMFYCNPHYFTGGIAFPNEIQRQQAKQLDRSNCYYAITQSMKFSTVDATNEMRILAVPLSNESATTELKKLKQDAETKNDNALQLDDELKRLGDLYAKGDDKIVLIKCGDADSKPITQESVWTGTWRPSSSIEYTVQNGDSIISIAHKYASKNIKGKYKIGDTGVSTFSIAGENLVYPLIAVATYHKYLENIKENTKFWIDPNAPDAVHPGQKLIIPKFTKYSEFNKDSEVAKILNEMSAYYRDVGSNQWSVTLANLSECIKQGGIVNE